MLWSCKLLNVFFSDRENVCDKTMEVTAVTTVYTTEIYHDKYTTDCGFLGWADCDRYT